MPNHKSPAKRLRQDVKRAARNHYVKRTLSTLDKKMRSEISIEEKQELINTIYSKLDKAAKSNVIHKRTASRRKARIAAYLAKEFAITAK